MIQVVFQGGNEEYDLDEANAQMSCKIDFINSQICNELKTVVSEWYDALPNNSGDHKIIKFILKNKVKFQNFILLSFLTAGTLLVNYLFSIFYKAQIDFLPTDNNHKLFLFLTSSIVVLFMFYQIGSLYSDRMMRKQIGRLRRNPIFEFTKGDKNKFADVAKENKKHLVGLFKTILIGISINGLSALVGFILGKLIE
ncbi:hypothetical protein [Wenyingzhuangia sp. 2_MG-2023]|uniref:hypothetical protein n=1 Tax=Wenyingzhuangia sp. 2_MG-2023 TaxID=3062639 RepID=UPI0026E38418|nr:hypothetical protein [Wenyingzhuangia sp. 2_MG-2023]MDO6737463.1 hypothetical protein [Wenyingzhuangia sp. 2_MG-2023]